MSAERKIRVRRKHQISLYEQGYQAGHNDARTSADRIYGSELKSLRASISDLIATIKEQDIKIDRLQAIRQSYMHEARSTRHTLKALWYAKGMLLTMLNDDLLYVAEDVALHDAIDRYLCALLKDIANHDRRLRDKESGQTPLFYDELDETVF